MSEPTIASGASPDLALSLSLTVKNTGSVAGSEVVQVYVTLPPNPEALHPPHQLKGFAKVRDLAPGAEAKVDISLDKYAVSYWDDADKQWVADKGTYVVEVGSASDKILADGKFVLKEKFSWRGL